MLNIWDIGHQVCRAKKGGRGGGAMSLFLGGAAARRKTRRKGWAGLVAWGDPGRRRGVALGGRWIYCANDIGGTETKIMNKIQRERKRKSKRECNWKTQREWIWKPNTNDFEYIELKQNNLNGDSTESPKGRNPRAPGRFAADAVGTWPPWERCPQCTDRKRANCRQRCVMLMDCILNQWNWWFDELNGRKISKTRYLFVIRNRLFPLLGILMWRSLTALPLFPESWIEIPNLYIIYIFAPFWLISVFLYPVGKCW